MELILVVSEMGEQWSPKTEPASTDEIVSMRKSFRSGDPAIKPIVIGITSGNMMLIVPHEVPVENAINF